MIKRNVHATCFSGNRVLLRDSDFSSLVITLAASDPATASALAADVAEKAAAGIIAQGISVRCDDLALADTLRMASKELAEHDDLAETLVLMRELFRSERATLVWTMARGNLASKSGKKLRPTKLLPLVLGSLFGVLGPSEFANVAGYV